MLRRGTAKDSNYDIGDEAIQASELSKLQRQLRVMENDRKAYAEESNNILRKKEAETAALLKENLEIRTVLKLAQSDKNESIDIDNMMKLVELVDSLDNYNKEIQDEVAMTADLEKQIMKAQEEITKQRRLSGGSTEEMCEMAIQKKIRVMENRLDKAMIKFNQQLAVNGNLRQEIDHLRQERAVFDGLFRALTTDLETIKYQMDEVISEAAQAYEERDEAQNKMLALKERSEKDINQHETEMKDLQRIISHDNKLKEFMMVKSHDRADYKEEEDAKKNKNTKDKNTDAEKEQITTCEQAFKLITDVTGDLEIEEIVENFIKKENENFALFNYVNELNGEVEQLHEDILRIHKEITDFQKDDVKMEETRKNIMSELETKSEITSRQTQAALERIGQINEVLDELKVGVANLFDTINCDSSTIQSLLGSEENVSDKNILKYMGIIEQKTMELLQMQQYIQMKKTPPKPEKKDKKNEPAPPLQTRTDIPPPISIVPPATGDDLLEFIDEMDVRPLTQEELRSMASTNIYRRQNKIPSVPTTQLNKRSKSPRP